MSLPLAQPEMWSPSTALVAPTALRICKNASPKPATVFGSPASSAMPVEAMAAGAFALLPDCCCRKPKPSASSKITTGLA